MGFSMDKTDRVNHSVAGAMKTLGLSGSHATAAEIRKSYRAKALKCHPDKKQDDPACAEEFKLLLAAKEFLEKEFEVQV